MKLNATVILATVSVTSLILSGCEDSSARQRDQVQTQISQAKVKLTRALMGSDDEAAPALQSVVADLSRIEGGEPGQQAAKSMLTAAALREVASIKLAAAENIESAHRIQRSGLHAVLDAAQTLGETAAALESVDAVAERRQLQREIESAQAEVAELRGKIEQLDGPISERAMQNANNKSEVDALRLKVNDLRRRAQELGHADGFDTYREAVDVSRQADQIEYEIAQREIDLEHSLTPELTMTDAHAQQLDALIASLETARTQLEAFASATAQEVSNIRKRIAEYASLSNASIKEMDAQREGELASLYDEAQAALERAASQSRSAATQRSLGQEDLQAARITGVQSQEMLGRLHWSRARGLGDHLGLLQRLASLPGADSAHAEKVRTLTEQYTQGLEQAKAAYEAAQEQAASVQSPNNPQRIDSLNTSIERAIAALGGEPFVPAAPAAAAASASPASPALPPVDVPVFQSADELRDYLNSLPKNGQSMRIMLTLVHASTPAGQRMKKAAADMTNAFASIDDAMRAEFGQGLFDLMGPSLATITPDLSKATVSEQTEDRVVYTTSAMGQTSRTVLRKIDGTWKIDVDDLDAQTAASLPMMEQMAAEMAKGAGALVSRIESGEFKTAQEVMAAFGQIMMGGGPGGAPGVPGGAPRLPAPPPPSGR